MIPVFSEMRRNNWEMILMKKFICGTMAAVMAFSMTGCNMGQSDTVTTAEETNAENTAAQAGATYTGTVTEVSATSITVETGTDGEVSIPLSDSTTFVRDGMGRARGKHSDPAGWCRLRHGLCAGQRGCNSYRGKLQHRCRYLRCSGCR